jgi:hypothetical protein
MTGFSWHFELVAKLRVDESTRRLWAMVENEKKKKDGNSADRHLPPNKEGHTEFLGDFSHKGKSES